MRTRSKRPHGQVRLSQVVTTFGPGSMLDLPTRSVLVSGLDHWTQGEQVHEPRLAAKLRRLLDRGDLTLHVPPPDTGDPTAPLTGIRAWQFPEWFITQDVRDADGAGKRSRLLIHRRSLTRDKYIDQDKKRRHVVPVRFVRACRAGHIGDIDWHAYVHRGQTACRRHQLFLDERGTSGDLSEVWVRCACGGAERPMSDAATLEFQALGHCDGSRPWLGPAARETCGDLNRLLIRTASNAYFPQLLSVISLPSRDEDLVKAVDQVWEHHLQYVEALDDLRRDRTKKLPVRVALEGFADEEIFAEVRSRRGEGPDPSAKPVKQAELETLLAAKDEIGQDRPDGDFYARALPREHWEEPWMAPVERVVLVHRLREVVAQVGFTRFEALSPDIEGELEVGVRRAALALDASWLPAVENRGEGVFLAFRKAAVEEWLQREAVQARGRELLKGFDCWRAERHGTKRKFLGLPYIMLHSLSHLLITAVSLECGYPASAIRERVYANGAVGYGILFYTGSPDAEGTLGGLVEAGRRIDRHLRTALDLAELCSNDPVCAQHAPEDDKERRFLLGAACHGCLLIAETSCEQHNDFLDRALVVPTVCDQGTAFFGPGGD
ncbi:MAG: DUF1998 domain-containing protein [Planctomycetes bacterium]|nr:DUF1998 domain-containing protein [Planctomycetota bacterium]